MEQHKISSLLFSIQICINNNHQVILDVLCKGEFVKKLIGIFQDYGEFITFQVVYSIKDLLDALLYADEYEMSQKIIDIIPVLIKLIKQIDSKNLQSSRALLEILGSIVFCNSQGQIICVNCGVIEVLSSLLLSLSRDYIYNNSDRFLTVWSTLKYTFDIMCKNLQSERQSQEHHNEFAVRICLAKDQPARIDDQQKFYLVKRLFLQRTQFVQYLHQQQDSLDFDCELHQLLVSICWVTFCVCSQNLEHLLDAVQVGYSGVRNTLRIEN
eukprot:TRINITY_DN32811_c0_g1_i2.p1 TRINITY_DN32811_c0_g1~~TRINITY_DN32811_c0_g1_i2.p1  ORF type:complete len:269 (-),score=23.21 TRINITY_DN32811_c0_g1_i2:220-1026(-)